MLPEFSRDIPELLKKTATSDLSAIALIAKSDTHVADWKKEITEMAFLKLAERCPSHLLDELGYMLSANILPFDAETAKRIKIYTAVQRHKNRGSWVNDAKIIIDSIAGGSSVIVSSYYNADWLLWAKESTDSSDYTATIGTDGVDDELGIDLIGAGDECEIAGVVWIDVDNGFLTVLQVEQLVVSLTDVVPVYFRVVLGYFNVSIWTVYAIMG